MKTEEYTKTSSCREFIWPDVPAFEVPSHRNDISPFRLKEPHFVTFQFSDETNSDSLSNSPWKQRRTASAVATSSATYMLRLIDRSVDAPFTRTNCFEPLTFGRVQISRSLP